jgi:hypothetical protein
MNNLTKNNMHVRQLIVLGFLFLVMISCEKNNSEAADATSTGKGGSMARFTIAANHLYLVDYSTIEIFDISGVTAVWKNKVFNGFGIETIFPYKDKLFIGSRDGMFIYSITDPAKPVMLGSARHVRSCDPVVADDKNSYVTLRGGNACGPAQDGLYIYDIKDIMNPKQLSLLPLQSPFGLGLKDSVVFVCRGSYGLTAVNVKNPSLPKEMYTVKDANFVDVITMDQLLICYVTDGLLLYDISNLEKIEKLGNMKY